MKKILIELLFLPVLSTKYRNIIENLGNFSLKILGIFVFLQKIRLMTERNLNTYSLCLH